VGGDDLLVRPFVPADEGAVLELLATSFADWGRIAGFSARDLFRWKHWEGPFGESLRLVASVDGQVAGFIAYMRWPMRSGERTLASMRGVDLAVDPRHRRRGIGVALIRDGTGAYLPPDVSFTWSNPNERSSSRTRAAGHASVGGFGVFTPPHVPLRLRTRLGSRELPRVALRELAQRWRSAGDVLAELPADWSGTAGAVRGSRLHTSRDLDFLRWRYGRFDEYRAVRTSGTGAPRGLAIFRLRTAGRFVTCHVCELLVSSGDWRTAREVLADVRRGGAFAAIGCCMPSALMAARCGLVPARGGATIAVNCVERGITPDPTQRSSWSLSLGDLELL